MSSPILFSRLISRMSRLPTQPFFVPKQNFISITVQDDLVRLSEREQKEDYEQAEIDVSEFGSDPYPFWRKVPVTSIDCISSHLRASRPCAFKLLI